jgi:hypothetical protein
VGEDQLGECERGEGVDLVDLEQDVQRVVRDRRLWAGAEDARVVDEQIDPTGRGGRGDELDG